MPFELSYMGTKRQLAPAVAEVISRAQIGPVLDAFAGMGAVGEAVGIRRPVWNNDVQVFASEVSRALFASVAPPPRISAVQELLWHQYRLNRRALQDWFGLYEAAEIKAIRTGSLAMLRAYYEGNALNRFLGEHGLERREASKSKGGFPYNLFTLTYADAYFGVNQAIDIDSIVYAIHAQHQTGKLSDEVRRWLLVGLGRVLKDVSTTTGHFAQYLTPNANNLSRFIRQRQRSVWAEFLSVCATLKPVGDVEWRRHNKVFNEDSLALIDRLHREGTAPSAIYADPPYTEDQYSRYYHVLETLFLYDYPVTKSKGKYRPDRFSTPFSVKSKVVCAFDAFVQAARDIEADLILSYPDNGLLYRNACSPLDLLSQHYRRVEVCHTIDHQHSTFGASHGASRASAREIIYFARI